MSSSDSLTNLQKNFVTKKNPAINGTYSIYLFFSAGPPSFSSNLQPTAMTQVPSTGIGSPNDLGLVPTAAGPQNPTKPTSLSPAPPPSNSGGGGGSGGEFQQTSYNGTELVMLYDYKVDLRLNLKRNTGNYYLT